VLAGSPLQNSGTKDAPDDLAEEARLADNATMLNVNSVTRRKGLNAWL
jgi:hypothetical protein